MNDYFSISACYDDAEDYEPATEHSTVFAPFSEDEKLAAEQETQQRVETLLALSYGDAKYVYDFVFANVTRKGRSNLQHRKYVEIFHAVVRLALERKAPELFAQWIAGERTDEMRERIGAEIKLRMRPSQMILSTPPKGTSYAQRKINAAHRAAGIEVRHGRPRKTTDA